MQISHSYIPYGEHGAGLHSSKVLNSLDPMKELAPIALDCVRSFQVNPGSAFTIADYGSADGGNSMPLIYSCVEELRKLHGSALEILIFYEDQPTNDFTSVFSLLQGTHILQTNNKSSHLYLGRIPHQQQTGIKEALRIIKTSSNQRLWECVRCRINVYPDTLNDFPSWLSFSKNQPCFINNRGFTERYFSDKVHASLIDWWLRCVTVPVSVDSHV